MSYLKFNHVFLGLMGLSVLTGFILPARYANRTHPEIQALFAPVSAPVSSIGRWAHNRFAPDTSPDRRADNEIRSENDKLKFELAYISRQFHDLQEREQERSRIGSLKDLCTPFAVVGGDPGPRESLQIRASTLEGLRDKMFVLYGAGGIAGQIQRAGFGGAQVRLITDTGFRERAGFARVETDAKQSRIVPVVATQALVEGIGRNRMIIRNLTYEETSKIQVGDLVVLDEPDWPAYLKGRYLGHVTAKGKRADAPQFGEIRIEPRESLLRLQEVMVITKDR